jgi:DNA-binding response OmpR family regulator
MGLLIVEDETGLAALTRQALVGAGFAVDIAPNLGGAEEHVAVAPYDIIILDLGLIDGDGLTLLRSLRRAGNTVPVLILTAARHTRARLLREDIVTTYGSDLPAAVACLNDDFESHGMAPHPSSA